MYPVTPTITGSGVLTTTSNLHGIFSCEYSTLSTISSILSLSDFTSFKCINGFAPTNTDVNGLIGV